MNAVLDSQALAFALAAGVLTLAPGADTMLVIRNVMRGGRIDGLLTTCGVCVGLFVHATLSAVGVSALLVHSAQAFHALRLIGAAYLVWLGIQSLRSALRTRTEPLAASDPPSPVATRRRCVAEGLASNVLNPKTALFYLAFLPQFISPTDAALAKSMSLAGIHFVEAGLWLGSLAFLVGGARAAFLRPAVRRWIDASCGALLIAFGARLAIDRS